MVGKNLLVITLTGLLVTAIFAPNVLGQSPGSAQDMRVSTGESPLTKDEIMARVREAYTKTFDVDDIAADVDRRGIDFVVDETFAKRIQFFRAAIVSNALWRADDRRKALLARPTKPEILELEPGDGKHDLKSLPFIEQARAVALTYVESLPNFIVREQVQRYYHPVSKGWKLGDYLDIEVSYEAGKGEQLKLKQKNGSTTYLSLDEIGGLTSTGQFAGALAALFNPESKTEFLEQGKVDFYGQPCVVYSFRVATRNSRQQLKVEKASVITGYRGQIYLQRDTKQVLRFEQESIEIPPDFPLSAASSTVDFGWVTISGKDYLLPIAALVSLTDKKERFTSLNCLTFHKYGKFETEVKIDVIDKN